MKKSTVKAAKTTTPAKKASAKIVKKTAIAPVKRPAATSAKPIAPKAPSAKAPAVKAAAAAPSPTVISARIDVGFGNVLYLRGEGPGLSWDIGVPLDCVADDKWSISLPASGKPVIYKFLINDTTWSIGPDFVIQSGDTVTVAPSF